MVEFGIEEFGAEGSQVPVTFPKFSGVRVMLSQLPRRGVGVIWGQAVAEEFAAYAATLAVQSTLDPIVGGKRFSVRDYAARRAPMYARARYKVQSFLAQPVPGRLTLSSAKQDTPPLQFANIFDLAAGVSVRELGEFIRPHYYSSRRVKDGIENDVARYLAAFDSKPFVGDVVIRAPRSYFTFETLLLLWAYYHSPEAQKLVILTEGARPRWAGEVSIALDVERDYIEIDEFISASSDFFGRREPVVETAFSIWQNSKGYDAKRLIQRGYLTEGLADDFLSAFAQTGAGDEVEPLGLILPAQKPAPLRFASAGNKVDILPDRELEANEPRVIGAAVSSLRAIEYLRSTTNLSNIISSFDARLTSISAMLTQIKNGEYDDNLVVQLGTELEGLESRISIASDMISEESAAEAASFLALTNGLLAQFGIWGKYRANIQQGEGNDTSAPVAREILDLATLKNDIATGRAKERLSGFLAGLETEQSVPEVNSGAVIAAENMISQAASQLAEIAQKQRSRLSADLMETLKLSHPSDVVTWFSENREQLERFSEVADVQWLRLFMEALSRE
ncbi:MAG: hypothetical protein K1X35_02655 [Caulobacteraceae bacterium]|nr:hypothetical protein [Caulobacteraceae bacterium]